jgi:phospholipid/cholesterol/gamma-HCH transport system permease protein
VTPAASLSVRRGADGVLAVALAGPWTLAAGVPPVENLDKELAAAGTARLTFDSTGLTAWDSGLLTFLTALGTLCAQRSVAVDRAGLPVGVRKLLELAEAVPERTGARGGEVDESLLERVGRATLSRTAAVRETLDFVGRVTIAAGRLCVGRARFRRSDLAVFIQQTGAEALPIVTLISFLVGLIFAFVGAVQLVQFGATIYVANLVGIAMVRDMGAVMAAIVMAGRTGASYAAQLGSMKINQEIDALTTMGISPMEFLVLPRLLALTLMMPLLCLYADAVGILGGAAVGIGMLNLSPITYYNQTVSALTLTDVAGGVFKAAVYGVLVALFGCLRGIQSGSSSSAVGDATTEAVVSSIIAIVTACGVFAVLFYLLGF